jgi:hypothetical protein
MNEKDKYKKLCLQHINRFKLALKIFIRHRERFWREERAHTRAMNLLKAQKSPFTQNQINHHVAEKFRYSYLIDEAEVEIIKFAAFLKPWLGAYDNVSSFHERAVVLGISHIALEKKVNEYKEHNLEEVGLYELIMVHHGEWQPRRGEVHSVPADHTRMPLFWSFLLRDRHRMETEPDYREAMSKAFDEVFPGIPKYQECKYPDGTTEMVRSPPVLKIASNQLFENDSGLGYSEDNETFLN